MRHWAFDALARTGLGCTPVPRGVPQSSGAMHGQRLVREGPNGLAGLEVGSAGSGMYANHLGMGEQSVCEIRYDLHGEETPLILKGNYNLLLQSFFWQYMLLATLVCYISTVY